jgi:CFEM domain
MKVSFIALALLGRGLAQIDTSGWDPCAVRVARSKPSTLLTESFQITCLGQAISNTTCSPNDLNCICNSDSNIQVIEGALDDCMDEDNCPTDELSVTSNAIYKFCNRTSSA